MRDSPTMLPFRWAAWTNARTESIEPAVHFGSHVARSSAVHSAPLSKVSNSSAVQSSGCGLLIGDSPRAARTGPPARSELPGDILEEGAERVAMPGPPPVSAGG